MGGVYSVYKVATSVLWVWRLVKYLDSYHLRSLYEIENWLWNNPPPFGVKYYILVKAVMFFLDGESLSVLQRHKHLKNMQCSHEHCTAIYQRVYEVSCAIVMNLLLKLPSAIFMPFS